MNAKSFDFSPLTVNVGRGPIAVPPIHVRLIAQRIANDARALIRDVHEAVVSKRAVRRMIKDRGLFFSLEAAQARSGCGPGSAECRLRTEYNDGDQEETQPIG